MALQLDYRDHSWYAEGDKFIITNDKPHIYERNIKVTPSAVAELIKIFETYKHNYKTVDEFIENIPTYPQSLDPEYDGHCPCSNAIILIGGKRFAFYTRCWRVSELDNYQELNIQSELSQEDTIKIAEALRDALDNLEWYNPYQILFVDGLL